MRNSLNVTFAVNGTLACVASSGNAHRRSQLPRHCANTPHDQAAWARPETVGRLIAGYARDCPSPGISCRTLADLISVQTAALFTA
jgi:hypothetical protein